MFFLVPIIILSVILIGWTYAMVATIVAIFPVFSVWLMIVSMIGTISFLIGIVGANVWPRPAYSRMYFWGAISIGSITVAWFIAIIMIVIGMTLDYTYIGSGWLVTYIVMAILANAWGIYSSWVPRITTYQVNIDKEHDWHGKKIVMIGDTHYGNIYGVREARSLVKRINAIWAEVVLIPGDFFDGPLIDYASIVREFGCIRAPHGVFFANGNHEEYTHSKKILKTIKNPILGLHRTTPTEKLQNSLYQCNQDITVINNEKVEINGMVFAGVTYHDTENARGLEKNLDALDLDPNKPTILLKHKPTLHSTLARYPIDLVVSWHTHQAQMWPFSIVTYMIYGKYVYGKVVKDKMTSITTSGVGTWWPPHRIGTRSEIVVIEIV